MFDIIRELDNTFKFLDDNKTTYFDLISMSLRQSSKVVKLTDSYFDFKRSGFLRPSLLNRNKEVLYKLIEYESDDKSLICTNIINNGFEFKVYDKYGKIIFKDKVIYFENLSWLANWYLKRNFKDLAYGIRTE